MHAVAATPKTPAEIAAARAEIIAPLSKASVDSTFTVEQQLAILGLCAKYRPVLSLSRAELGKGTAEATFPLPDNYKPASRRPYRANPRTKAAISKCVQYMLNDDIIVRALKSVGARSLLSWLVRMVNLGSVSITGARSMNILSVRADGEPRRQHRHGRRRPFH